MRGKWAEDKLDSRMEEAHEGDLTQAHKTVGKAAAAQTTTIIEKDLMEVGTVKEWTLTIHYI